MNQNDREAIERIEALIANIDRTRALQPAHMAALPVAPTLDGNTSHGARVDDLRTLVRLASATDAGQEER